MRADKKVDGMDAEPSQGFSRPARPGGAEGVALGYAIQKAAMLGDAKGLAEHLALGGNPRARSGGRGETPLLLACGAREVRPKGMFASASGRPPARDNEERVACVEALLASGARIDEADQSGATALHWAARAGLAAVARALIAKGADVEALDATGATPLMTACERHDGYKDGGVEDALLAAGAKVDAQDRRGESALHKAASNPGAIARLMAAGADVGLKDKLGRTALHKAVEINRGTSSQLLLLHGADPLAADAKGRVPSQLSSGGAAWRLACSSEEAARIAGHIGAPPGPGPNGGDAEQGASSPAQAKAKPRL